MTLKFEYQDALNWIKKFESSGEIIYDYYKLEGVLKVLAKERDKENFRKVVGLSVNSEKKRWRRFYLKELDKPLSELEFICREVDHGSRAADGVLSQASGGKEKPLPAGPTQIFFQELYGKHYSISDHFTVFEYKGKES